MGKKDNLGDVMTEQSTEANEHSNESLHWSDCAVHNAPALPPGPCDCGGLNSDTLASSPEHIERIRRKAMNAEGLGPFWRSILLAALNTIDAERKK